MALNHAFLIVAHDYPEQLAEIVHLLDAPNHFFFIHIDKKNAPRMMENPCIQKLKRQINCNVISCISVNWGGYSQIQATLLLLQMTSNRGFQFAFYHLISGQDYPLVTPSFFDDFFESHPGSSFMGHHDHPFPQRYERYHLNDMMNVSKFGGRWAERIFCMCQSVVSCIHPVRKPLPMPEYKGCNWWSLHEMMFKYLEQFLQDNPSYVDRFRHTSCCDEIFFHTILFNSPLRGSIVKNSLRYVDWMPKRAGEHLPRTLDETDIPELERTKALFCRKIHPQVSKEVINWIKNKISNG